MAGKVQGYIVFTLLVGQSRLAGTKPGAAARHLSVSYHGKVRLHDFMHPEFAPLG